VLFYILLNSKQNKAQNWNCAGSCWSMPGGDLNGKMPWLCSPCTCGYGQKMVSGADGGCYSCPSIPNAVPLPTQLTDCTNTSQYTCAQGFYDEGDDLSCVPCIPITETPYCPYGFAITYCLTSAMASELCVPCTNPIPNTTSQWYGPQKQIPSCVDNIYDGSCALFLTPSWGHHTCEIYCNVGYVNVNTDLSGPPKCQPCTQICDLGTYCSGVSNQNKETRCIPCSSITNQQLPLHAEWMQGCSWECSHGYYLDSTNLLTCRPCPQGQICISSNQVFLGCSGTSMGHCTDTNVHCTPPETFLYYEVYSAEAVCKPCTTPTLGSTFIAVSCSDRADTQILPCSLQCPEGFFQVTGCNLTADITCKTCTSHSGAALLMVSPCNSTQDAQFKDCPEHLSCDGSELAIPCQYPKLAQYGRCICPPATREGKDGKCYALECRQGWYPNATIDNCSYCGEWGGGLTLHGVLGLEACICAPGYFIERLPSLGQINCWPCGDLLCAPGIQEQTPCMGLETLEPECICSVPPGTKVLDPDRCTFACQDGFDVSPDALTMAPNYWDAAFVTMPSQSSYILQLNASLAITGVIIVSTDMTLISTDTNTLFLVHNGKLFEMDVQSMVIQSFRKQMLSLTLCRDIIENRFWVGFSYTALQCGNSFHSVSVCSTVELIELRSGTCSRLKYLCYWANKQDCDSLQICPYLLDGFWGNTMQAGFTTGSILKMAMDYHDSSTQQLFLLLSTGHLYTYVITYYAPMTPNVQRLNDPLVMYTANNYLSNTQDYALAVVGGTVFLPGYTMGPASTFIAPLSTTWLSALGDHALIMDSILQVDIWNGVNVSMGTSKSSTIVVYDYGTWVQANTSNHVIVMSEGTGIIECPIDTVFYNEMGNSGCVSMQCVRLKDACGDFSVRILGKNYCMCQAGYYRVDSSGSSTCQQCPENHYCTGDGVLSCPGNSYSQPGSVDISQCMCNPGYYYIQGFCLSCPPSFWCYGDSLQPIQCTNSDYSTTLGERSASPLDCICVSRTHGFTCQPCNDNELCYMDTSLTAVALKVLGNGPINSPDILQNTCLHSTQTNLYNIPGPPLKADSYSWGWVVATVAPMAQVQNLSVCMQAYGFQPSEPVSQFTAPRTALGVYYNQECDLQNEEWPGTDTSGNCVCIAGYSYSQDPKTGLMVCVPCLNGTFRARWTPDKCIPCKSNNSYAPWMAMSHCICLDGFYNSSDNGCQPISTFKPSGMPWMYSPPLIITLSILLGILCVLCSIGWSFVL